MFREILDFFKTFKRTIIIWTIILILIALGITFHIDKRVIAGIILIFGVLAQAFSGLIAMIGVIPFIGPIAVKILTLPIFWILNALGYFVSIIAIKKGYSKDVLNYRVLTVVLLTGIIIGYILGKLI